MRELILSVDLDEFYHVRWVSGSKKALYSNPREYFNSIYNSNKPSGDLYKQTNIILNELDHNHVKCTFFILGEVAEHYPDIVKIIAKNGHEIGCHSYRHIDLTLHTKHSFKEELHKAKHLLENISGQKIIGFRMPNLIIENWVKEILLELDFKYDSSICPARSLTGKFGDFMHCPTYPYRTKRESFEKGTSDFWEFPLPVFPLLKIPGSTGNVTRALGKWWTYITLWNVYRQGGVASYYFHPWEIAPLPDKIKLDTFYKRLFTRRTGEWMKTFIREIMQNYKCVNYKQYIDDIIGF